MRSAHRERLEGRGIALRRNWPSFPLGERGQGYKVASHHGFLLCPRPTLDAALRRDRLVNALVIFAENKFSGKRLVGKSKPTVWRWQKRFMKEGAAN